MKQFILIFLLVSSPVFADVAGMARVGPGSYKPFYSTSKKQKEIKVAAFHLDVRPVTNAEFYRFVRKSPKWSKAGIKKVFADDSYLSHWTDGGPAAKQEASPVINVSWFAAKAYCEDQGKRLPTEDEWELAASASETSPSGREDAAWKQRLLDWYSRPNLGTLPDAGVSAPNYWGIKDLHGLVWEWVLDFNSALVANDSREAADPNKMKFCGAGALAAEDKENYASFMRTAFRSSLKARYTTKNLGFRCAADLKEE